MKILEILDSYYPCIDGPINVVKNYSKNLNKTDKCTLATSKASRSSHYVDNEEFDVIRCLSGWAPEKYRNAIPELDLKFQKGLEKQQFDIIHTHSPFGMGRFAIKLGKKKQIPVVATLHTQYKEDFRRVLHDIKPLVDFMVKYIMKVYNQADSVWTVNTASCEILRQYGYKGKIEVVRNGTDLKYPENADELIENVNSIHNLKGQQNVFIFVGRISMYKNLELMADALKILKEKGIDFKTIIVGGGFDLKKFKEIVENNGLTDNFIFTGPVKDRKLLQGYYLRSDLFLFPSTFDTSSLVPVEAAAHKLPTLLIKGSYTAENIVDDKNGFLADENANSYAEKIEYIISNKELLRQVGDECHKSVYRTWEQVAEEVREKYMSVIKEYTEKHNK